MCIRDSSKADESVIDKLEKENVTIYENFYKEEIVVRHNNIKNDEDSQSTLRFYVNREEVDKVDLMAVSYTHLDVYKRQDLDSYWISVWFRLCSITLHLQYRQTYR